MKNDDGRRREQRTLKKAACFCFDTVNTIAIECADSEPLREAVAICEKLELLLDRFRPGSDIWRVNHADGKTVDVDAWTEDIVRRSIDISGRTKGVFDISVGSVSSKWKFGSGDGCIPAKDAVRKGLEKVDYRNIRVGDGQIRIPRGMMLDLGGIAKGYAADLIAGMMNRNHVSSGILNLGGNIGIMGRRMDGTPWNTGIVDPTDKAAALGVVSVPDRFLSVSGIYERYIQTDQAFYHHILDVETGMPVKNDLLCVAILSECGTEGDAIATACMCMGFERAIKFLDEYRKAEALFAFRDHTLYWYGDPGHISISEKWRCREWKRQK